MARRLETNGWWYPATAGFVALVALFAQSRDALGTAYVVIALAVVPLAFAAHHRGAIERRVAVGLTAFGFLNAATVALRALERDHPGVQSWSEISALLTTVFIIGGIGFVAHNRRGADFRGVVADGGIVALGSWLLAWVTIVRPALDNFDRGIWRTVLLGAMEPLGTIVLFLLVIVVFSDTAHTQAVRFLSGAVTLAIAGGVITALHDSGHIGDMFALSTALAMVANGLLYAALAHPSVKTLLEPQPRLRPRGMFGRIMTTTTALVVPIVVMSATTPADGFDRLVRTVSVGLLALVATARIIQTVRGNKFAQEALLHTARTDTLTGLPNRGHLLEAINATLHESWKGSAHPTLFFIDLDRFKNINDSLGHLAGDRVLMTIADRLRRSVPERATVARISGDEYVVLDPASPSLDNAMELAQQLLTSFREPLPLASGDVFVTASIGVARSEPQSHRNADVLLRHADTAMYQAKDAGRNCVALFDESMHERVAHRLTVETALFRALDRRELRMYHQPILDMSTGDVVGFEALMRWQQGDGTIVSPAEFIPIAEDTGTIIPIGSWALQDALATLRTWIDTGVCSPLATMSVNVSPRQLADPDFPTIVNDALHESGVSPHLLWLEVTEGVMITEPELALATLRRLRSLGVRVAIDDFGTGYSSLSLLQKFPLQRIKIDRAFVHGLGDNNNDRSLVRTIIAMGLSLGLDMVAEGVETIQQLQVLSELGCTKAQGYLISHPVPPDAMRSTVSALERMGAWPGVKKPSGFVPAVEAATVTEQLRV